MKIITKNEIDKVKWNEFVKNHKDSNPFQLYEYYESFDKLKYYTPIILACIDEKTDNIHGGLIAIIHKEESNYIGYFSRRSIIIGGPLVDDSNETLSKILESYNKIIKNKAIYSQIRNFYHYNKNQISIFSNYGLKFYDHLNILKEIPSSEDLLWKQLVRSRKDGVNKANKHEFVFSEETYSDVSNEFFELLSELYRKIKMPFPPKEYFDSLYFNLKDNNIKIFTLKKESKRIIILFSLYNNRTLYAYYIGITQNNQLLKLRPVDLFYYEVLKWCVNNNIKVFDWMGAGKPDKEYGVRKFKLEYGGEVVNLGRFEKVHYKILYNIGRIGFSIWRKLK